MTLQPRWPFCRRTASSYLCVYQFVRVGDTGQCTTIRGVPQRARRQRFTSPYSSVVVNWAAVAKPSRAVLGARLCRRCCFLWRIGMSVLAARQQCDNGVRVAPGRGVDGEKLPQRPGTCVQKARSGRCRGGCPRFVGSPSDGLKTWDSTVVVSRPTRCSHALASV